MGIRNLNHYLRNNCSDYIKRINVAELSGKSIAIDISIYLYKYDAENALLENIYLMLSIFKHYNITPIFIFDGKSPIEKKELLIKRRCEKENAKKEYELLQEQLEKDVNNKNNILSKMHKLKRQIVQINKTKIENVKSLIRAYGATYYDAHGEADELCALLVITKKVWACLSEDMDLFVYGCTRVLRYFSIIDHSIVLYYTKGILNKLNMTQKEFKEICVLSGSDYNINDKEIKLEDTMNYFKKYKLSNEPCMHFYDWLKQNNIYHFNIDLLYKITNMFDLDCNTDINIFKNIKIMNGQMNTKDIQSIMDKEDFIFLS
jgi:5'-3' exonuclease